MKVYLPDVGKGGGVQRHIDTLRRLLADEVEFVDTITPDAVVHVHATTRAPRIDVYTNHGMYPAEDGMAAWKITANRTIFDNLRLARHVIAVSQHTADQWADALKVTPHIIHNGVDPAEFTNLDRNWLRQKVGTAKPIVLWGKTAINSVLDPGPALELALRLPEVDIVTPLAPGTIMLPPPNFHQIGEQPWHEGRLMLAGADVLLATTMENCPIQVIEAMAARVPVVGYAWGGTAEVVATTGMLVPPGDVAALATAVTTVVGKPRTSAAYFRVQEHFTAAQMAERTLNVYRLAHRELVAENAGPKVSVVVAVYNKEAYVAETLRSVLAQTDQDLELVVIDDGSTDNSLAEVEKVLAEARIPNTLITGENQGVCAARNTAIAAARGKYIVSLDADDLIEPQFVSLLAAALDGDPLAGIAYSDVLTFRDTDGLRAQWYNSDYDLKQLVRRNFIPSGCMFRKRAWAHAGGYNPVMAEGWEDWELWLDMGLLGWYGKRVPIPLFNYRVLADGRDAATKGHEDRLRGLIHQLHRDVFRPTISVVIPCYKQASFLFEAIKSVHDQTWTDWEIIVVDDGNAAEEAGWIAATCELTGARYIQMTKNSGLAWARNAGIREAQGQYILCLDADDVLEPTALADLYRAIDNQDDTFAYGDWIEWDGDNAQVHTTDEWDTASVVSRLTFTCTILYPKVLWEKVGGYAKEMSDVGGWEDWDFVLHLIEQRVKGVRVPQPVMKYRQHSTQQMRLGAENKKLWLRELLRKRHPRLYYRGWS